jgi:hypothetical protein
VLNVVICGGFSPGARVLRAAMHGRVSCDGITLVTLGPALAGLEKPSEDIRALDPQATIVVDACEGGCGNQGLAKLGVKPKAVLVLPKYPMVSEKNVKDAEQRIARFIQEMTAP